MKETYKKYLITAGGRIKCHRCQARSSRSKQQCLKPSLKNKRVCLTHGGASTGPKTAEGIKRIKKAHWKHGNETKEVRAKRRKKSLMFQRLEEIGWHIGMFTGKKTPGRKSGPALNLNNQEELLKAIRESKKS
jgi:hypothetical protein